MIEDRKRIVEVAKTWLGTPYHHLGRVKGAGCDCATLIAEVFHEAGVIDYVQIDFYSPQWHLHRSEERYLNQVLEYTEEVSSPNIGDIVLFKFGRTFSHGAIVVDWPLIIHARIDCSVEYENAENCLWLKIGETEEPRPRRFFSRWPE